MIGIFEIDFTGWSNLTAAKNHPVGKTTIGLVVNYIGFAYVQPFKRVSIDSPLFSYRFTFFV